MNGLGQDSCEHSFYAEMYGLVSPSFFLTMVLTLRLPNHRPGAPHRNAKSWSFPLLEGQVFISKH